MSVEQLGPAENPFAREMQALGDDIESGLDHPAPFTVGYQFEVTGGRENLRHPDSWARTGRTAVGDRFAVTAVLPARGNFQYVLVQREAGGESFALCINDALQQQAIIPTEVPTEPVRVASLDPVDELLEAVDTPAPFPRENLTAIIQTPDNLRHLSSGGLAPVQLSAGDEVTFIAPHSTNGRYEYWEVAVPGQAEHFRLCVNDQLACQVVDPAQAFIAEDELLPPDAAPVIAAETVDDPVVAAPEPIEEPVSPADITAAEPAALKPPDLLIEALDIEALNQEITQLEGDEFIEDIQYDVLSNTYVVFLTDNERLLMPGNGPDTIDNFSQLILEELGLDSSAPAPVEPLIPAPVEITPEAALNTDLLAESFTPPPTNHINPNLLTSEGVVTAEAQALRIESCIPWGINEAYIVINANNRGNGAVPTNQVLAIVRENGSFVFADPDIRSLARGDGRVRIAEGDQLTWEAPPEPELTEAAVNTYDSVMATVMQEKLNWIARDLVPESLQNEAVCAAFVQNYLTSTLGMDFMINSGLITPGEPTPDAWEMIQVMREHGHAEIAADLSHFFQINSAAQTIRLDETSPEYQTALQAFVDQAWNENAELGLVAFHYKHTATNPRILGSDTSTLNSHVTVNLGPGTRELPTVVTGGVTVSDYILSQIEARVGRSYDQQWEAHRPYLGMLQAVQVLLENGETINLTFNSEQQDFVDANGDVYALQPGDRVHYDDVQVAHFYHNADRPDAPVSRIDGLVELLIQGNFEPVAVTNSHGFEGTVRDRVDARGVDRFIAQMIPWEGSGTVTRESLINFYVQQYEQAMANGVINPADPQLYAERATTYVYSYTHKALLDLAGGGSLPRGTQLPLLDWAHKPGEVMQVAQVEPVVEPPQSVGAWLRSWFT